MNERQPLPREGDIVEWKVFEQPADMHELEEEWGYSAKARVQTYTGAIVKLARKWWGRWVALIELPDGTTTEIAYCRLRLKEKKEGKFKATTRKESREAARIKHPKRLASLLDSGTAGYTEDGGKKTWAGGGSPNEQKPIAVATTSSGETVVVYPKANFPIDPQTETHDMWDKRRASALETLRKATSTEEPVAAASQSEELPTSEDLDALSESTAPYSDGQVMDAIAHFLNLGNQSFIEGRDIALGEVAHDGLFSQGGAIYECLAWHFTRLKEDRDTPPSDGPMEPHVINALTQFLKYGEQTFDPDREAGQKGGHDGELSPTGWAYEVVKGHLSRLKNGTNKETPIKEISLMPAVVPAPEASECRPILGRIDGWMSPIQCVGVTTRGRVRIFNNGTHFAGVKFISMVVGHEVDKEYIDTVLRVRMAPSASITYLKEQGLG